MAHRLHGDPSGTTLLAFLDRHDVPVGEAFKQLVGTAAPTNVSARGRYEDYYDDELRELVGSRVSRLI